MILSEADLLAGVAAVPQCCSSGALLLTCKSSPGSEHFLLALVSNKYDWDGLRLLPRNCSLSLFPRSASLWPKIFLFSDRWAPSLIRILKESPIIQIPKPPAVAPVLKPLVDLPDLTVPFKPLPLDFWEDRWKSYLCSRCTSSLLTRLCNPWCSSNIIFQTNLQVQFVIFGRLCEHQTWSCFYSFHCTLLILPYIIHRYLKVSLLQASWYPTFKIPLWNIYSK